jgi:hypothetical protein
MYVEQWARRHAFSEQLQLLNALQMLLLCRPQVFRQIYTRAPLTCTSPLAPHLGLQDAPIPVPVKSGGNELFYRHSDTKTAKKRKSVYIAAASQPAAGGLREGAVSGR